MKLKSKSVIASVVCVAVLAGAAATGVSAAKNSAPAPSAPPAPKTVQTAAKDEKQDETVYVFAAADGTTQKVVASDWIKTEDGSRYTKRNAEDTLPVTMRVCYQLDGEDITPKKLAGKSGALTIRYEFENHKTQTVQVNGAQKTVNVPFAVITGVILDDEVFTQVEVSGGKLVNDGDRTMVLGLSFPGLRQNLGVTDDKLDLPDHLEIRAQVKDFSMLNTMTLVTNEVFRDLDAQGIDDLEALTAAADKLTDAMTQLLDGSGKLEEGLATLQQKSGELSTGVEKLSEGAQSLKNGASQLDAGMKTLSDGAGQLSTGLDTLSQNSAALNAGAAQVFDTLLAEANKQLEATGLGLPALTKENYAQVLNGAIDSLDENAIRQQAEAVAREKVTAAVMEKKGEIEAAVTAEAEKQVRAGAEAKAQEAVLEKVLAAMGLNKEQFEQLPEEQRGAVEAAVNQQMATNEVKAMIEAGVQQAMQSEEILALIAQKTQEQINAIIEQQMLSPEVQQQITDALAQANAGAAALSALKGQLDSYNQFYTGLAQYTAGVDTAKTASAQVAAGAGELKKGSAALSGGTVELANGVTTMKDNMPALIDGVNQLHDGSKALAEGLSKFNQEGIQKLVDALNGDMKTLVNGLQASLDAAKQYTGLSEEAGPEDCVKFLYRTESIG